MDAARKETRGVTRQLSILPTKEEIEALLEKGEIVMELKTKGAVAARAML